jgi:hypothetical protein
VFINSLSSPEPSIPAYHSQFRFTNKSFNAVKLFIQTSFTGLVILGEMDNFYTIVDSIGEGILSWADPDMKYSGYTKVGFFL